MSRKFKFPLPKDYKPAEPAVICPADRVIDLYNQESGDTAKRIAKKVRKWFSDEARKKGWAGVRFSPEVQTNHGAGCVLWRPPEKINVSIKITQNTLILSDQAE